ncbi:unnamed protein product [Moneuplotes crassus]|uniref:Uncharacterized protein n=1 Tax=Euplotes crassus TaxID=5936 RepID=A0AAD2D8Z3_EUPCR|nr:unnamed protein product [Moneuplotes crassus]
MVLLFYFVAETVAMPIFLQKSDPTRHQLSSINGCIHYASDLFFLWIKSVFDLVTLNISEWGDNWRKVFYWTQDAFMECLFLR